MKNFLAITTSLLAISFGAHAAVDGNVVIDTASKNGVTVRKSFYGVDLNGFATMPRPDYVSALNLGYVKFGGSLHSVYNWELNMYLDRHDGIQEAYSPLATRIQGVQSGYHAAPMFQVNMLGLEPDYDSQNHLVMMPTADATHAANAIKFLNGQKALGIKHILMGNEPFIEQEVHGLPAPSADEYIAKYIKYAVALRDAQASISGNANDIELWGPELSTGYTLWQTTHPLDCTENYNVPGGYVCSYGGGQFTEFIPYFLSRLAAAEHDTTVNPKGYKLLDVLTFHYYPLFRTQFGDKDSVIRLPNGQQNVAGMLESVNLWNDVSYVNKYDAASPKGITPKIVQRFQTWRNKYYSTARIAVTECGVDSVDNINYHPIVRPLYLADLMGRLGSEGIDTFVNSFIQGASKNDSWGMIVDQNRTSLYWVYNFYSNNFLGDVVQTADTYGDKVNSYAVKTAKSTNIILVNKDVVAHSPMLSLVSGPSLSKASSVTLPAWSMTLVIIPNDGSPITKQTYGAKEMGIPVTPVQ
ncbi:MAG TPA: glycoside hydrolase family 44 protein [Bdellovibrio sp.]|uniref:glycoside hydrolase family 44 protein n=1 Tax=Bdellovibrio sp. TaxID=28201 RepID=UPI002F1F59B8